MRCRDIGCFVAPNGPSPERNLANDQGDPCYRQSPKRGDALGIAPHPKTKCNYGDGNNRREKPMRHLQPDLERVHVGQTPRIAPGVDLCKRSRARVWNPPAICRREIENRKVAMLMAHRRAERKLHIDRDRSCNRNCFDRSKFLWIDSCFRECVPEFRSDESDYDDQPKKSLREARVKDADFVFQHGDSKSAEHALQNHRAERDYSKITNPLSRFAAPKPAREDDRQKPHPRSNQAVSVLKKNPADPF